MRRHVWIVAAMLVAGCTVARVAPAPQPAPIDPTPPERVVWGPPSGGLALRVKAPSTAARGDLISVDVFADVVAPGGTPAPTLTWQHPALFVCARLTPAAGGDDIVIPVVDPTGGMPDPPPPPDGGPEQPPSTDDSESPSSVTVDPGARLVRVDLSLAFAWERVVPGAYRVVFELVHDGSYCGAPYDPQPFTGTFRGTLRSQPFTLDVTPAPKRTLEVRVPASFLGGEAAGTLLLPVRNGFVVGMSYRGQLLDGSTGGSLGGPPAAGMFDELLAQIAAARGHPTFTIFETSYFPEHMWHPGPGSGHHRVLYARD